ncbi:hypothetical protein AYI68_g2300 [Smittium mucronatum]|uniref:Uncharacterized protein n=1 Tax=Smittium mucronatum TaxID=133383 RepID=A0A1R0H345_9FUNG|nr:hypothetical protein AYI68_g2300 [Smittium mucronatum]
MYGRHRLLPASTLKPKNPKTPLNILSYEPLLQAKLQPIRATIQHNNEVAKAAMRIRNKYRHRETAYENGEYLLLKCQIANELNSTLGLSTAYAVRSELNGS